MSLSQESLPELLWHYTDAAGTTGIVEGQCLWATDVEYLNDSSELAYASRVARHAIRRIGPDELDPETRSRVEELWPLGLRAQSVHVCCFCERSDVLSQWRAYGRHAGYALGFSTTDLLTFLHAKEVRRGAIIRKIVYEPQAQMDIILEAIRDGIRDPASSAKDPSTRAREIWPKLIIAAWYVKHPTFLEEQEWRATIGVTDETNRIFRTGDMGLIPYLELIMEAKDGSTPLLPINQVIVGPTSHPAQAKKAVVQLLAQNGYKNAAEMVKGSDVPLRT